MGQIPAKNRFEEAIEESTGMTVDHIRETPLCELRKEIEERNGRPLRVSPEGAGLSHEDVEKTLDEILKQTPTREKSFSTTAICNHVAVTPITDTRRYHVTNIDRHSGKAE